MVHEENSLVSANCPEKDGSAHHLASLPVTFYRKHSTLSFLWLLFPTPAQNSQHLMPVSAFKINLKILGAIWKYSKSRTPANPGFVFIPADEPYEVCSSLDSQHSIAGWAHFDSDLALDCHLQLVEERYSHQDPDPVPIFSPNHSHCIENSFITAVCHLLASKVWLNAFPIRV